MPCDGHQAGSWLWFDVLAGALSAKWMHDGGWMLGSAQGWVCCVGVLLVVSAAVWRFCGDHRVGGEVTVTSPPI